MDNDDSTRDPVTEALLACRARHRTALVSGAADDARTLVTHLAEQQDLPILDLAEHYLTDLRGLAGVAEQPDGRKESGRGQPPWSVRLFDAEPKMVLLGEVERYHELSTTNRSVLHELLKDRRNRGMHLPEHVWLIATASTATATEGAGLPAGVANALMHLDLRRS